MKLIKDKSTKINKTIKLLHETLLSITHYVPLDIDALSMKPTPWIYNLHILQGHSFFIFLENLDNENCFQSSGITDQILGPR